MPEPAEVLRDLREYVGFTEDDERHIALLRSHLEERLSELASRFYEFILSHPSVYRVIHDGGFDLEHLRNMWMRWARALVNGPYDAVYAESRLRIGRVHHSLGVQQRYTIAAFSFIRRFFDEVVEASGPDQPDSSTADRMNAIHRVLDVDLALISEAYDETLEATTIEEQNEQRRTLEGRLAGLMQAAHVLIFSIDRDGIVTQANQAFARAIGRTLEQISGQPLEAIIPASGQAKKFRRVFDQRNQARGCPVDEAGEPVHLVVDLGNDTMVSWYCSDVPCGEILWLGYDITERRRLEREIQHQEKMAAMGLLAAGVAHEIGNPLSSISSVAQTLQRKVTDEFVGEKLTLIRTAIDRINTIVRQMGDFARPSRVEWRAVDVNRLLENALNILRFDRRARSVDIESRLMSDLPTTLAMEDQLTQVFVNISLNAFDAMLSANSDDRSTLRVSSSVQPSDRGDQIVVTFEDNGPGVPSDMATRIFEPFFTTKEVGHGTGLGLSVSYRIIEEHGGRIRCETADPHGARFVLELPVRNLVSSDASLQGGAPHATLPNTPLASTSAAARRTGANSTAEGSRAPGTPADLLAARREGLEEAP